MRVEVWRADCLQASMCQSRYLIEGRWFSRELHDAECPGPWREQYTRTPGTPGRPGPSELGAIE